MKRTTDWNVIGAQESTDPRLLQNQDMQRSGHIWRLSQWLERQGYLTAREAADTRSAVAANVIEHISQNQVAYNEARDSGVLDKWRELAAGYEVPGETSEGQERRHRAALTKTVQASIDMELAQDASPERLRAAADLYGPGAVNFARQMLEMTQKAPGDDDGRWRDLSDAEKERVAATVWYTRNQPQIFDQPELREAFKGQLDKLDAQEAEAPSTSASDWSATDMDKYVKGRDEQEAKSYLTEVGYSANKAPSGHSLVRETEKDNSNGS